MDNKIIQKFIFALLLALIFIIEVSLGQTLPLQNHTLEDGLPSSFVTCIFQDSSGFIWMGTQHGLSRFDGVTFQNFYVKNGMVNDFIQDLRVDRHGNLWIGTLEGLMCRNAQGWRTYTTRQGLPHNRVSSIVEDLSGNLWIGTNAGVCKFDGKQFITYASKDGLIDDIIGDIAIDQEGAVWLATRNGLSYFANHHFINYTDKNGLINNKVQRLLIDHNGNLWAGTQGGISVYDRQQKKFVSYTTRNGLPNNTVQSIIEDRNHNIWIGTASGLSFYSEGAFTNFYLKSGLPDDSILSIFEDREGNIWFGTSLGVSRLQSLRFLNFTTRDGLPNNVTWAILEEKKDRYWIGTDNGLSCYAQGKFTTYTTRDGLENDRIYDLLLDRHKNIWIAGGGGVSVYRSGRFTNYTARDGLPNNIVLSLCEDRNGVIWIGTIAGICRYEKGQITQPTFDLSRSPIHAIMEDSKGNLWYSDIKGLNRISGNKSTAYSTREGLIHNRIYTLFEDSRGRIWIATQQGLSCLNHGTFTNYTTAQGLSDEACYFVLEDGNRNLWIGTGKGLDRFDGKSFNHYTSRDGLASSEMSKNACLKDSQGYLWFGTNNGLTRYNPSYDHVNTIPPPVYITGFDVLGHVYPVSDDIRLEYNQNHLQVSFIGLSFSSPRDVSYKYRMEGIDRYWSETVNRSISYSSLAPGTYTFKVTARNNDGFESITPAQIRFVIEPPFWQTIWFRATVFVILLFIAVLFLFWYVGKEKKKIANQARNKQLVMAQRMELMGVLAGGAVHDLKNLLSVIIGYTKMAVEFEEGMAEEEKDEALGIIKDTATTAIQLVQQILSFARQSYDLTTAANLPALVDEILAILKVSLPQKITIQWQHPEEEVWLYINPVQFKQVVLNICLNAIQAMEEQNQKGNLEISLAKDQEEQVILKISDTGPGIPRDLREKIFEPLYTTKAPGKGTGLGLFVVKQIVKENKAKIHVHSELGQGTTFTVTFPPPKEPEIPEE